MPTTLKTSLAHLPEEKRDDLRRLVKLVLDEFGDEIEMLILYGSHARNEHVEELAPDGRRFQYQSDYDIMVVTTDKAHRHSIRWRDVKDAFREPRRPSLQMECDTISFLNRMIEQGYYFYVDIAKEGIALYDSGHCVLSEPKELTSEEMLEKAQKHYDCWFESAQGFYEYFKFGIDKPQLKIAAFILHQVTERLLAAYLLVHTDYKPKIHDLDRLVPLAAARDVEMLKVFPKGTKLEEDRFVLLCRAYVDARYNASYAIAREDLDYLAGRVEVLQELVRRTCLERIERLKSACRGDKVAQAMVGNGNKGLGDVPV